MSQHNLPYTSCPKKIASRVATTLSVYRSHFGHRIPADRQYWAMCGRCSHEKGILDPHSEPQQMIDAGLISPNQFHGVEFDPTIYTFNKESSREINWHLGDFYETMVEYSNSHNFRPAIVNADMIVMPKFGSQYLSRIMQFLTPIEGPTMLLGNFVTEYRHRKTSIADIVSEMERQPSYQLAMNSGRWHWHDLSYWYRGTGRSGTKMNTVILFKD